MLRTIIIFSEDKPGVLYRIADLFLRRKINIESLTVSKVVDLKLSRFTITVECEQQQVEKIVKQIYRIIEVVKVVDAVDDQLLVQEVAIYRVGAKTPETRKELLDITKLSDATVKAFTKTDVILSKTGTEHEINQLYELLSPYGIKEFIRSGRIAIATNNKLFDIHSLQTNK